MNSDPLLNDGRPTHHVNVLTPADITERPGPEYGPLPGGGEHEDGGHVLHQRRAESGSWRGTDQCPHTTGPIISVCVQQYCLCALSPVHVKLSIYSVL